MMYSKLGLSFRETLPLSWDRRHGIHIAKPECSIPLLHKFIWNFAVKKECWLFELIRGIGHELEQFRSAQRKKRGLA